MVTRMTEYEWEATKWKRRRREEAASKAADQMEGFEHLYDGGSGDEDETVSSGIEDSDNSDSLDESDFSTEGYVPLSPKPASSKQKPNNSSNLASANSPTIDFSGLPEITNKVYYPHYWTKSRYLVLMGGAGSGKSFFAAQKLIYRMISEPGHRFLVVRKVGKTLRQSCFALLRDTIAAWGLSKLIIPIESDLRFKCANGSEIIMAGLDDVEKLKSIQRITGIWIEEASEVSVQDWQQLDIRMRGKAVGYIQMILTFNPVSVTHWLKDAFFDHNKGQREETTTLKTTYKDNRFLDRAYVRVLEGFKHTDEYYYMVYCLGEWGVFGKTVYNARMVTERLSVVRKRKPMAIGSFIYRIGGDGLIDRGSIKFVRDEKGPLKIYEAPCKGYPYVIGADVAEGGIDSSVASVRNNATLNQAAVWRGHLDTDLFAKQLYCLGIRYNKALIGVETNFDLHPVKELERLQYPKQYVRKQIDSASGRVYDSYGFRTTKLTRPLIISQHVTLARENINTFNDLTTLDEMLTFVRSDTGRPEAQDGKHDDTIIADAITLEIREQQTQRVEREARRLSMLPHELRNENEDERHKIRGWAEW